MKKTKYSSSGVEIDNEIVINDKRLFKMIKEDHENMIIRTAFYDGKNNISIYEKHFIDTTKEPESIIDLEDFFELKKLGLSKYIFTILAW